MTNIGHVAADQSTAVSAKISSVNYKNNEDVKEKVDEKVYESEELEYNDLTVKIIEDRSHFPDGKNVTYPAVNVKVSVLGSEQIYRTDSRGQVYLSSLPSGSTVAVKVTDDDSYYRNGLFVVGTDEETATLRLLRTSIFHSYSDIVSSVPRADSGSICGEFDGSVVDSLAATVSIDGQAEGPYYFNDHGFIDSTLQVFSGSQKFCFFNVETGPNLITFMLEKGESVSGVAVLASSSHLQKVFTPKLRSSSSFEIKSLATAREHFLQTKNYMVNYATLM